MICKVLYTNHIGNVAQVDDVFAFVWRDDDGNPGVYYSFHPDAFLKFGGFERLTDPFGYYRKQIIEDICKIDESRITYIGVKKEKIDRIIETLKK